MNAVVVALLAGGGAGLALPPDPRRRCARPPSPSPSPSPSPAGASAAPADAGWIHRWRGPLSALAGVGAWAFVGGLPGAMLLPVAAVGCWLAIGRVEPTWVRREREQVARDLPHLVRLLGAALAAGAAPAQALDAVTEAAPGVASALLAGVAARLRLGGDPAEVWSELARSPLLAPLGRALAHAHSAGAPVAVAVARLADDLSRAARSGAESRARSVGVKAAVPLGVCLLPCFLLLGIVPLAAGLLTSLSW